MLLVLEAELIAIHFPLARVAYARGKAHNCMMPPLLDFWFDFASTYSYPAAMQIVPAAQQAGVMVRFRPFLLGPLFKAQGWPTSPFKVYPAKGRYIFAALACEPNFLILDEPTLGPRCIRAGAHSSDADEPAVAAYVDLSYGRLPGLYRKTWPSSIGVISSNSG